MRDVVLKKKSVISFLNIVSFVTAILQQKLKHFTNDKSERITICINYLIILQHDGACFSICIISMPRERQYLYNDFNLLAKI